MRCRISSTFICRCSAYRRGAVPVGIVGIDDDAVTPAHRLGHGFQLFSARRGLPVVILQLLFRGQPQAEEAVLFGFVQLGRVMGFTLPQITSSRLSNRGCRAAPVRSRPSRPGRMAAKPAHPASALSFPFCRSTSPVLRMSSTDFASQIWMPGPFSRMGSPGTAVTVGSPLCSAMMAATSEFRTGSKGSCPNTLWATGIPSMSCCPSPWSGSSGEGRYEEQLPVRAFLRHLLPARLRCCPGARSLSFINAGAPSWRMPAGRWRPRTPLPAAGDVARFRIDHQDFRFIGKAFKVCMGIGQHHRSGTGLRDLHSGVQRSRKVICQYQSVNIADSPLSFACLFFASVALL